MPGAYEAVLWNTRTGRESGRVRAVAEDTAGLTLPIRFFGSDVALAITPRDAVALNPTLE